MLWKRTWNKNCEEEGREQQIKYKEDTIESEEEKNKTREKKNNLLPSERIYTHSLTSIELHRGQFNMKNLLRSRWLCYVL